MMSRALARLSFVVLALVAGRTASFADDLLPVPAVVIYPGDVIRDDMLVERALAPNFPGVATAIRDPAAAVGKTARHTLLPGLPIASNAVGQPKIVSIGAMVRVVFVEGGLTIMTYASALQAGSVGDVIPVRNTESGLIISGTIEPDGSIRVGNS